MLHKREINERGLRIKNLMTINKKLTITNDYYWYYQYSNHIYIYIYNYIFNHAVNKTTFINELKEDNEKKKL